MGWNSTFLNIVTYKSIVTNVRGENTDATVLLKKKQIFPHSVRHAKNPITFAATFNLLKAGFLTDNSLKTGVFVTPAECNFVISHYLILVLSLAGRDREGAREKSPGSGHGRT